MRSLQRPRARLWRLPIGWSGRQLLARSSRGSWRRCVGLKPPGGGQQQRGRGRWMDGTIGLPSNMILALKIDGKSISHLILPPPSRSLGGQSTSGAHLISPLFVAGAVRRLSWRLNAPVHQSRAINARSSSWRSSSRRSRRLCRRHEQKGISCR